MCLSPLQITFVDFDPLCNDIILFQIRILEISNIYSLSGRIRKVVASHAAVARSNPAEVALIYTISTWRSGGTAHEGGWCDQSIGSTVSATRSFPLGCFSTLLQVVDN